MDDPFNTDEWREYERHIREDMLPQLEGSKLCVSLYTGHADVKLACELGFSILLDKPIVVMAMEGVPIPPVLLSVARKVIRFRDNDMEAASNELAAWLEKEMFDV